METTIQFANYLSPLPVGCLGHSKAVKPDEHPDVSLVELREAMDGMD